MLQLQTQKLLLESPDAFEQLKALGIKTRAHGQFPNLIQFTYNQIASAPFKTHPIVKECRGLILDRDNHWNIVAFPFTRFFNWGEPGAAEIDWDSARIQEKLDGSLIIVYWYAGVWHAATKGTPDGVATTWDESTTYAQYFWQSVDRSAYNIRECLIPGWTYCFEVTGQATRVVTQQVGNPGSVTLLAIRNQNNEEVDVRYWSTDLPVVKHFDFNTAEAVNAAADALDPMNQEGFVVVDENFQRIKIKSPRYVALHHNKFSLSVSGMVNLIRTGETDEVLSYFPELRGEYDKMNTEINHQGKIIDQWHLFMSQHAGSVVLNGDRAEESASRKQYAEIMRQQVPAQYHPALYALLKNQVISGRDWILSQDVGSIVRWMGFKNQTNLETREE